MKLKNVAKLFDRLTFADAYNLGTTFKGQMDVFDDSKRDGLTIERRIMSVAPAVVIPARRTVIADGITWLIGDSQRDYYKSEAIRHKYVVHQASELASVKTFEQAIANAAGTQAWAARTWIKSAKEIDISSDLTNVYDIYFARGETIPEKTLVYLGGRWHLVRTTYTSAAGLLVALVDELPEPVVTSATLKDRVYVRSSDSYTETTVTVTAVRIHWQSFFEYPVRGAEKYKPGDVVLIIRKADGTPNANDKITVAGESFNVVSVTDEGSVWSAHLRND